MAVCHVFIFLTAIFSRTDVVPSFMSPNDIYGAWLLLCTLTKYNFCFVYNPTLSIICSIFQCIHINGCTLSSIAFLSCSDFIHLSLCLPKFLLLISGCWCDIPCSQVPTAQTKADIVLLQFISSMSILKYTYTISSLCRTRYTVLVPRVFIWEVFRGSRSYSCCLERCLVHSSPFREVSHWFYPVQTRKFPADARITVVFRPYLHGVLRVMHIFTQLHLHN